MGLSDTVRSGPGRLHPQLSSTASGTGLACNLHAACERRHRDLLEGGALLDVLLPREAAESGTRGKQRCRMRSTAFREDAVGDLAGRPGGCRCAWGGLHGPLAVMSAASSGVIAGKALRTSGRCDRRGAHQRHVDHHERDAVADRLGGDDAREGVQGGLRGDVGGEPPAGSSGRRSRRCSRCAGAAFAHARQQAVVQADRAEVVELVVALEVVEAVVGRPIERRIERPALLTSMSTWWWSARTRSTRRSTDSMSDMSAA